MLPELFAKIHEPTVHCFAAVYLPDLSDDGAAAGDGGDDAPPPVPLRSGAFYNYDATEKRRAGGPDALTFLHEASARRRGAATPRPTRVERAPAVVVACCHRRRVVVGADRANLPAGRRIEQRSSPSLPIHSRSFDARIGTYTSVLRIIH